MAFLLVGNYGVGNLGDEALREYFESAFPEVDWRVLVVNPRLKHEISRIPLGIRSFLRTPWWKTARELRRCDGVVFGGGTLFTDIESVRACVLWGMHACVAFVFGKPVFLAFQGVGPFRTKIGKGITGFVFRRARFVSVRDSASFDRVRAMGVTNVVRTFDPIFKLFADRRTKEPSGSALMLIPRHNSGELFLQRSLQIHAEKPGRDTVILSMQNDHEKEKEFCSMLAEKTKGRVVAVTSIDQLCAEVNNAGFVYTQRFHGALAALALGKPLEICSQGEGDKLSMAMRDTAGDSSLPLRLVHEGEGAFRSALQQCIA